MKEPSESRCAIEPVIAAIPAASIEKQNIVTYMAGYLIKQYPVHNCASCKQYFEVQNMPQSSPTSQYELVRFKRYWDRKCLTYPSVAFSSFVQNIDPIFCAIFGGVMYQGELLKTLWKMMQNDVTQLHTCGNTVCLQRLQQYVKHYITVRIHYALEISNIGITHGHKRSRKMLKLCHE